MHVHILSAKKITGLSKGKFMFCISANHSDFHFINLEQLVTKTSIWWEDISCARQESCTTMIVELTALILLTAVCKYNYYKFFLSHTRNLFLVWTVCYSNEYKTRSCKTFFFVLVLLTSKFLLLFFSSDSNCRGSSSDLFDCGWSWWQCYFSLSSLWEWQIIPLVSTAYWTNGSNNRCCNLWQDKSQWTL